MRGGRRLLGLALPILIAMGCSESTGPDSGRQDALIPAAQEMTLRVGEEKAVANSVVRVAFGQVVEDSRCPIDAMCVWAGNAMVELGIRAGMGPTWPIRLNTTLEPRSTVWNGIRISLLELQPAPRAAEPTKADAYQVKVRLEPAG
jgi:hypothetical protein